MRIKRIFMAEADAGGSSLIQPAPAQAPTSEPQAQGAAQPEAKQPAADADTIAAKVSDTVFAALRKAGVFEKPKTQQASPPARKEDVSAPSQPVDFRALDRSLAKLGYAEQLSESQYKRLEKAYAEESPGDASEWVKDYFGSFGVKPAAAPAAQPTQPATGSVANQIAAQLAQPTNERPVSDRGAPPARVPLEEQRLIDMSESDRAALRKQKGDVWYRDKFYSELRGKTVSTRG